MSALHDDTRFPALSSISPTEAVAKEKPLLSRNKLLLDHKLLACLTKIVLGLFFLHCPIVPRNRRARTLIILRVDSKMAELLATIAFLQL